MYHEMDCSISIIQENYNKIYKFVLNVITVHISNYNTGKLKKL